MRAAASPTNAFAACVSANSARSAGHSSTSAAARASVARAAASSMGALASFAGVGHMLDVAEIEPGDSVLDLGSGAGTDAFIAARLTEPTGRVTGVDMTDAQLAKARGLAAGV